MRMAKTRLARKVVAGDYRGGICSLVPAASSFSEK
jgi:hypothetical protein